MLEGHGGNIAAFIEKHGLDIDPDSVVDLSVNTNPYKYPKGFIEYLQSEIQSIDEYPDVDASRLRAALASHHGIVEQNLIIGNGTTETLYMIPRALGIRRAVCTAPAYSDYRDAVEMSGGSIEYLGLNPDTDFEVDLAQLDAMAAHTDAVFLCHPNNPNGRLLDVERTMAVIKQHPDVWFIIDEAYLPLCVRGEELSFIRFINDGKTIVLRSMTKSFSIPGLRLGYAVAAEDVIQRLYRHKEPWTVNALAQKAGLYLCNHYDWLKETAVLINNQRIEFTNALSEIPELNVFKSDANFVLVRILRGEQTAPELQIKLMGHGFFIRDCSNYDSLGTPFFRIAIKEAGDMIAFIRILHNCIP